MFKGGTALRKFRATVQSRYAFLAHLDATERRRAAGNARHLYEVRTALGSLRGLTEGRDAIAEEK